MNWSHLSHEPMNNFIWIGGLGTYEFTRPGKSAPRPGKSALDRVNPPLGISSFPKRAIHMNSCEFTRTSHTIHMNWTVPPSRHELTERIIDILCSKDGPHLLQPWHGTIDLKAARLQSEAFLNRFKPLVTFLENRYIYIYMILRKLIWIYRFDPLHKFGASPNTRAE